MIPSASDRLRLLGDRRILALGLAVTALLAGCAPAADGDATPPTSASPSASAPAGSATPSPTPSDAPWQTVTAADGSTFDMPADWTIDDRTSANEVGSVIQLDLVDADGVLALSYVHDQGGLGGLGGACDTDPALEVLEQRPTEPALTSVGDSPVVDAAYGIEQPDGSVELTIGTVAEEQIDGTALACLGTTAFVHPADGLTASFATALQTGVPGLGSTAPATPYTFASFDEAAAYIASEQGQTRLDVVESLTPTP